MRNVLRCCRPIGSCPKLSSIRSVSQLSRTLAADHAEFLELVRDHGEGSITLTRDVSNSTIAVLTLHNETKKNAISGRMMMELAHILDTLLAYPEKITSNQQNDNSSESIVGLIIRGQGRIFCAGADLTLVRDKVNTSERGLMMSRFMTDALTRLRQSRFITVALLTGPAVGGGAELSTVADYRIMIQEQSRGEKKESREKEMGDSSNHICFIHASLGASPGWGGAYRLQSIVGRSNALRLLGSCVKVNAEQALSMGLVDQVVVVTPQATTAVATVDSTLTSSSTTSLPPSITTSSDSTGMSAAIRFLFPFTQQPYLHAVGDVKQVPNHPSNQTSNQVTN